MQRTRYSCQISFIREFSLQISEECCNIRFHENLSSGIRVVPLGWTDMTKLIVWFYSFANAPDNYRC